MRERGVKRDRARESERVGGRKERERITNIKSDRESKNRLGRREKFMIYL